MTTTIEQKQHTNETIAPTLDNSPHAQREAS